MGKAEFLLIKREKYNVKVLDKLLRLTKTNY